MRRWSRPMQLAAAAGVGVCLVVLIVGLAVGLELRRRYDPPVRSDGKLSLVEGGPVLTFDYATANPHKKNWIGLYNTYYGEPVDGRFTSASLAWAYAPGNGTVRVDVAQLAPGVAYRALFLARGKYRRLADAVDVVVPAKEAMRFMVDGLTTHNARKGSPFRADVGGMLMNLPSAGTRFAKNSSDGGGWVRVSPDGRLSGVPDAAGDANVVIEATGTDASTARLRLKIPVRNETGLLVDRLAVVSLNLWEGGVHVNDALRKQFSYLTATGADIVGLQESSGGYATRLGQALGWSTWQGPDVCIISRYPIVQVLPELERAGSVRVALDGEESQVVVWNTHLAPYPYGPESVCFDKASAEDVLRQEEKSGRAVEIRNIVDKMQPYMNDADKVPVLLTGDFNAPSHLDWTEATRKAHCDMGHVPWPTSEAPIKAGLEDSFRAMHPNPLDDPGISWSPIALENEGRPETMDRIDFIYQRGFTTLESKLEVVGKPKAEPDHADNEWPSDHAAVKSIFRIGPK